jgi:hypothetical protein
LVFSIFLFLIITVSIPWVHGLEKDEALKVIFTAEDVLGATFKAFLEAERTGADVSVFMDRMSLGAEYLGEANVRYRSGNYEDAVLFADLCIETITSIQEEATELVRKAEIDLDVMFFWSSVGVVIAVVTGFVAWRVFRRIYLNPKRDF